MLQIPGPKIICLRVLTIHGCDSHQIFVLAHIKFEFNWPSGFTEMFEHVDIGTDARVTVILLADQ